MNCFGKRIYKSLNDKELSYKCDNKKRNVTFNHRTRSKVVQKEIDIDRRTNENQPEMRFSGRN